MAGTGQEVQSGEVCGVGYMIFLTVGTEFPFDRLVRAVDKMVGNSVLTEEVYAQIGHGEYRPSYMLWVSTMEKERYDERIRECSAVIAHAGMGTILRCMELRKPLLVMPRLKKYGEHVNDHQLGTARRFESLGYILVAQNTQDLRACVKKLHVFHPIARRTNHSRIVDCIKKYLEDLAGLGK